MCFRCLNINILILNWWLKHGSLRRPSIIFVEIIHWCYAIILPHSRYLIWHSNLLFLEAYLFCAIQYIVACCVGEAYKNEKPSLFFSLGCLVFLMLLTPAPSLLLLLQLIHWSCRRLRLALPFTFWQAAAAAGDGGGVGSRSQDSSVLVTRVNEIGGCC